MGLGQVGLCASLQNLLARFDSGRALNACWRRELLHNDFGFYFYFLRLLQHFILDQWCRWSSSTLAWSTKGIRSIRFWSTCMSSFGKVSGLLLWVIKTWEPFKTPNSRSEGQGEILGSTRVQNMRCSRYIFRGDRGSQGAKLKISKYWCNSNPRNYKI